MSNVILDVRVKDQYGAGVAGVHVYIPNAYGAKTIATNRAGVAVGFTVMLDRNVYVYVSKTPTGYTHTRARKTYFINRSGEVGATVEKIVADTGDDDGGIGWGVDPGPGTPIPSGGEKATITNVTFPPTAKKGDELKIVVTAKNTGNETCELRAVLRNYEDKKIDTTPEERLKLFESVKPGAYKTFTLYTKEYLGNRWNMPDYDWNLKVELAEINKDWGSVQSVHHTHRFTVKLDRTASGTTPGTPDDGTPGDGTSGGAWTGQPGDGVDGGAWTGTGPDPAGTPPSTGTLVMNAPSMVLAGNVKISGRAPSANTRVDIMGQKKYFGFDYLAGDSRLASVVSDVDGRFNTTIQLDDFGAVTIYAKVDRADKPAGWLDWISTPSQWLETDTKSPTTTIFVVTWVILIALVSLLGLEIEKKYNYIGIFKKRGRKK